MKALAVDTTARCMALGPADVLSVLVPSSISLALEFDGFVGSCLLQVYTDFSSTLQSCLFMFG